MSERAGKLLLVLSFLTLLGVGFVIHRSYYPFAFVSGHNPSGDQITTDLLGKSVSLPQGQIWGFNPDQTLEVKVVSKRRVDVDTMVVTVDLTAGVRFPPPPKEGPNAPKPNDPPSPKKATLSGMAKVFYERYDNNWYLTVIEGINLKVVAE